MAKKKIGKTLTTLILRGSCNYDPLLYIVGFTLELRGRNIFLFFREDDILEYVEEKHSVYLLMMDMPFFFDPESRAVLREILFSKDVPDDLLLEVGAVYYDNNKYIDGVLDSFGRIDIECKLDRKGIDSKHYKKKRVRSLGRVVQREIKTSKD